MSVGITKGLSALDSFPKARTITMALRRVFLVAGKRTPFGKFDGSLKDVTPVELTVHAAQVRSGLKRISLSLLGSSERYRSGPKQNRQALSHDIRVDFANSCVYRSHCVW